MLSGCPVVYLCTLRGKLRESSIHYSVRSDVPVVPMYSGDLYSITSDNLSDLAAGNGGL